MATETAGVGGVGIGDIIRTPAGHKYLPSHLGLVVAFTEDGFHVQLDATALIENANFNESLEGFITYEEIAEVVWRAPLWWDDASYARYQSADIQEDYDPRYEG